MKAVAAAFIEIKTVKFTKKVASSLNLWQINIRLFKVDFEKKLPRTSLLSQVQVDPYLEDALCSCCLLRQGPYFCRCMALNVISS